jgi:Ser/Thr protein kinase RdoA (MazF antagonist)
LLPEFRTWCARLADSGVQPSLQHDDLHDGNVFVGPAGTEGADGDRIFDWGDAVVAHPFGTLLATLRSIASRDASLGRAQLLRLRDAYLEPWTDEQPRATLNETVGTALRVGAVGRAFAWERALSGVPPPAHGEYAGAVGEWLLELFEPTVI